jgi:hypothetical protein
MGYTRYWTVKNKLEKEKFIKFKETCEELVELFDIPLDELSISEDAVIFNGVDDNSHETFLFMRESTGFSFCKTQRKPYDILVCACLKLAEEIFKNDIDVSSDGENNDVDIENRLKSLIRDKKLKSLL